MAGLDKRYLTHIAFTALVLVVLLGAGYTLATDRYNGGTSDYCVNCHPSFQGRGDLHDLHVGNSEFTNNCQLCHISNGDNPLLMYSEGDNADGLGCMGCHGHDYGETILADYGVGLIGTSKNSGYGLRLQHFNKGVSGCDFCHGLPSQGLTPVAENIDPDYYARADVNISNACNTDGTEDGTPEPNGEDTVGLDNDGDLLIDAADPDCAPAGTPGEAGGNGLAPLLVTAKNVAAGTLSLTVGAACGASDQTLIYGPLTALPSYGYAGQDCSMDNSGSHLWSFGAASASQFFLVVSNDGNVEGSYGLDGSGAERPEDVGGAVCPLPQDLAARCD